MERGAWYLVGPLMGVVIVAMLWVANRPLGALGGYVDLEAWLRRPSQKPIKVDLRVIAATNRDLDEAIARGVFRADLFFRPKVVALTVPPLRERRDDIAPLAAHFLARSASPTMRWRSWPRTPGLATSASSPT